MVVLWMPAVSPRLPLLASTSAWRKPGGGRGDSFDLVMRRKTQVGAEELEGGGEWGGEGRARE